MAAEVDVEKGPSEVNKLLDDAKPSGIDDKKIQTAVKFLQNPKVRSTSFEKRISFLRNKGLSEEEIDVAIKKSGTEKDKDISFENAQSTSTVARGGTGSHLPVAQAQPVESPSGRFLTYLASVVVGGGLVYSANYLIQTYLLPYFYGRDETDSKNINESIKELTNGVSQLSEEMRTTLKLLENQLKEQQNLLTTVNQDLAVTKARVDLVPSETTRLSDVKSEIASVKGLLLGRNQFPSSPFNAVSTSPSIPAWQKVSAQKKSEGKVSQNAEQKAEDEKASKASSENEEESKSESTSPKECASPENKANTSKNNEHDDYDDRETFDDTIGDSEMLCETKSGETTDSNESFDEEIVQINRSKTLSSTYVKLDAEN